MPYAFSAILLCLIPIIYTHLENISLSNVNLLTALLVGFMLSCFADLLLKMISISFVPKNEISNAKDKFKTLCWLPISSGYAISKLYKSKINIDKNHSCLASCSDCICEKDTMSAFIYKANKNNLILSSTILLLTGLTTLFKLENTNTTLSCLYFAITFRVISRCIEIIYAFTKDVLGKSKSKSSLTKQDRIYLAFNSYIENILNFSVVYYFFKFYKNDSITITSIGESLLTSIGTATISSVNNSSGALEKIFVNCQVLTSLTLVVLSLAIYVSREK